jgi:hypothetical protein
MVVAGAAVYEATIALGWVPLGTVPGRWVDPEGLVLIAVLLAILAGCVLSWTLAGKRRRDTSIALLGVAAAAFMVARFEGFDPYYLPTLRRYSDGGVFSPWWVYGLALFAVAASALGLARPRIGLTLNAGALLLCALTATSVGVGH